MNVADAQQALLSAQGAALDAENAYASERSQPAWQTLKTRQSDHERAQHDLDLAIADQQALDAEARAAELAVLSEQLDAEVASTNEWPARLTPLADEAVAHIHALASVIDRMRREIATTHDASARAEALTQHGARTDRILHKLPSVDIARAIVRVKLGDLPVDVSSWVTDGAPQWNDVNERPLYDEAVALLGGEA